MTEDGLGTVTPGNERKMVPESDLIAVKRGLEGERDALKQQLVESKTTADTHYQTVLSERASREAAEKKVQDIQTSINELESLKRERDAAKSSSEQLSKQLLDFHRNRLEDTYKVPKTSLEGKTTRELEIMEEALKLTGARGTSGILTGGSNGSSGEKKTPMDKLKSGLAARRTSS